MSVLEYPYVPDPTRQEMLKKQAIADYDWQGLGSDEDTSDTDNTLSRDQVAYLATTLAAAGIRTIGDIQARPDDVAVALRPWETHLVQVNLGRDDLSFGETSPWLQDRDALAARQKQVLATRIADFKWHQAAVDVMLPGDDEPSLKAVAATGATLAEKLAPLQVETIGDLFGQTREDMAALLVPGELVVIDSNLDRHCLWLENTTETMKKPTFGQSLKNLAVALFA